MELEASVGFTIRSLSNLLRRRMLVEAPPPGNSHASETGGLIIGYLCDHPDREFYQRDIEEAFCIRRSTASRFLKDLERDGMLDREGVPWDARLKRLVPTEKARAIHKDIASRRQALEERMTAGLTPQQVEDFLSIARHIEENLSR